MPEGQGNKSRNQRVVVSQLLLASLSESYLRGSAVLLNIKGVKNRDFLSDRFRACAVGLFIKWRHNQSFDDMLSNSGNGQFGYFITWRRNQYFVLRISHYTSCYSLRGEGIFLILIASMFINQGHDQFSDKCRERQEFMDLFAFIFDQLWPIDHFTVLWHVTRPLYESEVRVDLDMTETKN